MVQLGGKGGGLLYEKKGQIAYQNIKARPKEFTRGAKGGYETKNGERGLLSVLGPVQSSHARGKLQMIMGEDCKRGYQPGEGK